MPIPFRAQLGALKRAVLRTPLSGPPAVEEGHSLEENRSYWNRYAKSWVQNFRGYEVGSPAQQTDAYEFLGDEWGNPQHVTEILDEFVYPFLSADSLALEIGSGGGRIAARVAPRVRHLYCMDISLEMLKRLSVILADRENVSYLHVEDATFPSELMTPGLDFVYSFDVFVHLDAHTQWKYIRQIAQALRPGGRAFLHTSNLTTEGGWQRFSSQDRATLEGHYFITPEILRTLVTRAGLTVETEASEDPSNFYKARDYLVLLRK